VELQRTGAFAPGLGAGSAHMPGTYVPFGAHLASSLPPSCVAPRQGWNWGIKAYGNVPLPFLNSFFPGFSSMRERFLLVLRSDNPPNGDCSVHNTACRQTARIDFPEVGQQNDECIGKHCTAAYLLFYIKLGFSSKYPLK